MYLEKQYEKSFAKWLDEHLQTNYIVHDRAAVTKSIVDKFLHGTGPVDFCANTVCDVHRSKWVISLRLKDDVRRLALESRYGKRGQLHSMACILLYNESVKEIYERYWDIDRHVRDCLFPGPIGHPSTQRASPCDAATINVSSQAESLLLTRLPAEIRNQIYSLVLAVDLESRHLPHVLIVPAIIAAHRSKTLHRTLEHAAPNATRQRRPPPLTLVCRQIRREALPIFFSENVFVLPSSSTCELASVVSWLEAIGDRNIRHLRYMVLECAAPKYLSWPRISIGIDLWNMTAAFDPDEAEDTSCPSQQARGTQTELQTLQQGVFEAIRNMLKEMRRRHPAGNVTASHLISLMEVVRTHLDPTNLSARRLSERERVDLTGWPGQARTPCKCYVAAS